VIELRITGTRNELRTQLAGLWPGAERILAQARAQIGPATTKEVWDEQAMAIGYLAAQYSSRTASFLELGTAHGFSAAIMRCAAPNAFITTLEPDPTNRAIARANLNPLSIVVRPEQSLAYLGLTEDGRQQKKHNLIFVDGDHKRIRADLPWWNRLKVDGLFLHHDYSPLESARPCPPVFEALNEFSARLGREPDVLLVDDTGVGLWGMYRRAGEVWES